MRLPESLLKRINEFSENARVCSRTFVVVKLLKAVFDCAEPETIREMMIKRHPREKGFVIRFEVEKGKIKERLDLSLNEKP